MVWPDADAEFKYVDRKTNDDAKQVFRRIFRIIAETRAEAFSMHFSPAAQTVFTNWFIANEAKIRAELNSAKRSHLGKYKGLLPKLAGLFQVVDLVANAPSLPMGTDLASSRETYGLAVPHGIQQIDLEHLQMAIRFLGYLETHMHRLYNSIRSEVEKAERTLAAHIRAEHLEDGFSIHTIQRKCWEDLGSKVLVEGAVEDLEERGWLRQLPNHGSVGRPTTKWRINPKVPRLS